MDDDIRKFIRVNVWGGLINDIEHYNNFRNASYINEQFNYERDDIRVFGWDVAKNKYIEVWSHPNPCVNCNSYDGTRKLHTKASECEGVCKVEKDEICDTEICIECGATV